MKRDVDPDEIISSVMAAAGKTEVDAAVLYDVAEAFMSIDRPDLAAEYAHRSYGLALTVLDKEAAARAVTLLVMRLGKDGRKILAQL